MNEENRSSNEGTDFMNAPFVKVATHEIVVLIREIKKSEVEKEQLLLKCQSLENHIRTMSVSPNSAPVQFQENSTNTGDFSCVPTESEGFVNKEPMDTTGVEDLEEDTAPESPNILSRVHMSAPELLAGKFVFSTKDTELEPDKCKNDSTCDSAASEPVVPVNISDSYHIGVDIKYFDSALEELSKVKELNSHLIAAYKNDPNQAVDTAKLQSLVNMYVKENNKLQATVQEGQLYKQKQEQIVSALHKKVFQQERQLQLNEVVFKHFNKQCDLLKENYSEAVKENNILNRRIAALKHANIDVSDKASQTESQGMPGFDTLMDCDNDYDEVNENVTRHTSLPCSSKSDQLLNNLTQEYKFMKEEKDDLLERMKQLNLQVFMLKSENNKLKKVSREAFLREPDGLLQDEKKITSMPVTSESTYLLESLRMIASEKNMNANVALSELNVDCDEGFSKTYINNVDCNSQPNSCPEIISNYYIRKKPTFY